MHVLLADDELGVLCGLWTQAFLATAVSPIMPISTFGYFAAVCIIMNYVFVCVHCFKLQIPKSA